VRCPLFLGCHGEEQHDTENDEEGEDDEEHIDHGFFLLMGAMVKCMRKWRGKCLNGA